MKLDEFEKLLNITPFDWQLRLVYADWLEDQGDSFCETQRWMMRHEICPGRDARGRWRWWGIFTGGRAPFRGAIPKHIFEQMDATDRWGNVTKENVAWTRLEAERALHDALVKLGEVGERT